MKKILLSLLIVIGVATANAQEGFHRISAGAELALPIGNFGNAYGIGFGASGKVFYGLSEKADITGTLGYLHFGMKDMGQNVSGSMGIIPILAGYRYDFGQLYAEPQLGLAMLSSSIKVKNAGGTIFGGSASHSESKISLGLGGGYAFGDWDLGARFQIIDNINFLGVRIGYNFSL